MEISTIEKELEAIDRNYLQKKNPTAQRSMIPTGLNKDRNFSLEGEYQFRNPQENAGLKNIASANGELEKLALLKNESLERLQNMNLYPIRTSSQNVDGVNLSNYSNSLKPTYNTNGSANHSGSIISPEINQILAKYSTIDAASQQSQQRLSNSIHEINELNDMSFNGTALTHQTMENHHQQQTNFSSTIPYPSSFNLHGNATNPRQQNSHRSHDQSLQENQNTINNSTYLATSQSARNFSNKDTQSREGSFRAETEGDFKHSNQIFNAENFLNARPVAPRPDIKSSTPSYKDTGLRVASNGYPNSAGKATTTFLDQTSERRNQVKDDNFIPVGGFNDKENSLSTILSLSSIPPLPSTSAKNQSEKKSSAFSNAMKALQDQVIQLETENKKIKKHSEEASEALKNEMKELKEQLQKSQKLLREKDLESKDYFGKIQEEGARLKEENARLRAECKSFDDQTMQLKADVNKLREDKFNVTKECSLLKKELDLIQMEKERHLEENANEKDVFERQLRDTAERFLKSQGIIDELSKELKIAIEAKEKAEKQLSGLASDSNHAEKKNQHLIDELQMKLEEALKHIAHLEEQYQAVIDKAEREKLGYQKKLAQSDEKTQETIHSYEQKLNEVKNENKELKRNSKTSSRDYDALKKKIEVLEKAKSKLEKEKYEKEELLKQAMEVNDELLLKMKKDGNNGQVFKNVLYRKSKLEKEIAKNTERAPLKSSRSNQSKSKPRAKSRSNSVSKSQKKTKMMSIDDLNTSTEDSRLISGRKKIETSFTNLTTAHFDSKDNTPRKAQTPNSRKKRRNSSNSIEKKERGSYRKNEEPTSQNSRKNSFGELEKPTKHNNLPKSNSRIPDSQPEQRTELRIERDSRPPISIGEYKPNQSFTPQESYSSPRNDHLGLPTSTRSNEIPYTRPSQQQSDFKSRSLPTQTQIDLMTESEISSEIVRVERMISELKREYKNLLSRSHSEENENLEEIRTKLNQCANELQARSEIHLSLKKKQREFLTKLF